MTQNYLVNKNVTVLAWKSDSGEEGKSGYNVKDEAGNVTWQSEEEFLKNHLPLGHLDSKAPHVQRMIIEQAQLIFRFNGLAGFLHKVDNGGGKPEGLSDFEIGMMRHQGEAMDKYSRVLGRRIASATERRLIAKDLPLVDGKFNVFGLGDTSMLDLSDAVGEIRISNVRTADGIKLSHDLSATKRVEGQLTQNYSLSIPGVQDVYLKVDPERALLSISMPSSIKTELFFDLEIVLENPNIRCS
jgi:hypothetical protein